MAILGDDLRRELGELVEETVRRVLGERPAAGDGGELLAPAEIARRTSTSAAHWRALVRRREIPSAHVGRTIRIAWSDVQAYLARGIPADELERRRGRR